MRKKAMLIVILLLLCLPIFALAKGTTIISTPATNVFGILILDDNGKAVGASVSNTRTDVNIDWTVEITPISSTHGRIYYKSAAGNWVNSGLGLDLTPFFGTSGNGGAAWYPGDAFDDFADDETDDYYQPSYASWPERYYAHYSTSVIPLPDDERYQSRVGPTGKYAGGGAYKTYKIEYCDALFIEGNYVYVELSYTTVGVRRLYFQRSIFEELYDVPQETLTGVDATLLSDTTARFGPGDMYDIFKEAVLDSGTPLKVFFSEDGWVFAEFHCKKLGTVRGWLPAELVEAN